MRKVHASFDEENQYRDIERYMQVIHYYANLHACCRINSKHNSMMTKKIVTQAVLGKSTLTADPKNNCCDTVMVSK